MTANEGVASVEKARWEGVRPGREEGRTTALMGGGMLTSRKGVSLMLPGGPGSVSERRLGVEGRARWDKPPSMTATAPSSSGAGRDEAKTSHESV